MLADSRDDLLEYWPQVDDARNAGFASALEMLSGTIPQQFDSFRRGGIQAQQNLLAGSDMAQNALLGLPVENLLKARSIRPDLSMFRDVSMPDMQRSNYGAPPPAESLYGGPFSVALPSSNSLLGGMRGFYGY